MYIFKAAAEASKAAGYLLRRAGIRTGTDESDEETAAQTDKTDKTDKTDNGAGNRDGNQQE